MPSGARLLFSQVSAKKIRFYPMKKLAPLSILWAVKVGAEDWQEEIITSMTTKSNITTAAAATLGRKGGKSTSEVCKTPLVLKMSTAQPGRFPGQRKDRQ